MKSLFVRYMVVGLVAVLFFPVLAIAQNISGTYALYQKGNEAKGIVGYMRISQQTGNNFSIGIASQTGSPAVDWSGQGSVQGNSGYYSWRFQDGKTGQTTFTIDNSGNLHGQVRGSGISWDYIAKRI